MPSSTSGIEGISPAPPRVVSMHYGIFDTPSEAGDTTTTIPTNYRLFVSEDSPSLDTGSVGDWYIKNSDTLMLVYQKTVGGVWSLITTISGGGGSGTVIGPSSSTDSDVVLFDGLTGELIKDSGLKIAPVASTAGALELSRGDDPRFTNSRTPTSHATTHESGGSDPIAIDTLAAATDNTNLNVSTSAHGLAPKLPNDATKYLDGTGGYSVPAGSGGSGPIISSSYTMATNRLLGRTTASDGAIEEISIGSNLTLSAGVLSATGGSGGGATTSTATGAQNDFDFSGSATLYMNNATSCAITGFLAGTDGQTLTVISKGAGAVTIANQDTGSSASNRVINQVTGTITLSPGTGSATLVYDATTARWRVAQHRQGALIAVPYSGANFTGTGSITWTVDSADQTTFAYVLNGTVLSVYVVLDATSVSGTGIALKIKIPGGFTAARNMYAPIVTIDNGTPTSGLIQAVGDTFMYIYAQFSGPNWTASSNNTYIRGMLSFDVL